MNEESVTIEAQSDGETVTMSDNYEGETCSVADGSNAPVFLAPLFAGGFMCIFAGIYLAVIIFLFVMIFKFVRAAERIAKKFEEGIVVIRKDDAGNDDNSQVQ